MVAQLAGAQACFSLLPDIRSSLGTFLPVVLLFAVAGLPALQGGESGQVRKEAAITIYCECRGKARHFVLEYPFSPDAVRLATSAPAAVRTAAGLSRAGRSTGGTATCSPW